MTKYFKDTNGKPFQDATENVVSKYSLTEISKTEFDEIVVAINTPTDAEVIAQEVAKQKSSSGSSNSGTMVIYDPVRDRQNKIDKGMEMITGRCTLGTDC